VSSGILLNEVATVKFGCALMSNTSYVRRQSVTHEVLQGGVIVLIHRSRRRRHFGAEKRTLQTVWGGEYEEGRES
jgi:hypothetical protein